jgi:hypothetical protein
MWKQLFLDTIYVPQTAARTLMSFKLTPGDAWAALILASCLNAIAFFVTVMVFPPVTTPVVNFVSPMMLAGILIVVMGVGATSLFYAGRAIAGAASFAEILTLVAWLQFMRLAVQIAGFVLMIFLPGLANIAMFLAGLYGIWILLAFITEAQGFERIGKALMNLMLAFGGMVIFFSILFPFLGLGLTE